MTNEDVKAYIDARIGTDLINPNCGNIQVYSGFRALNVASKTVANR